MLAYAPFWLAGAAIIALMSLFARANRCRGWRRERPGAEFAALWGLMEVQGAERASPVPLAPLARSRPPAESPDPANLVALAEALRRTTLARERQPEGSHKATADARIVAP